MLTTNKQQFLNWLVECGNDLLVKKEGEKLILSVCGLDGPEIRDTGIIYDDEQEDYMVARYNAVNDIEKFLQSNGYYSECLVTVDGVKVKYNPPTKTYKEWLADKKEPKAL